jgi:fimbrial isopeptide formation D2 family protein/LPXTG-motif cell wall-anchored protein
MKNAKRIASLLLALVMVFALAMTVSAERTEVTTLGSLLIKDNESVKASEKTFNAFKILDLKAYADGENGAIHTYEYVVPAELADFYAERYNADKNDAATFIVKVREGIEGEENLFDFAYAAAAAAEAAGIAPVSGAAVEGGYKFVDLPLGYYAVVDATTEGDYIKPVTAVVLDTLTPNREVEVKAEKPAIDKKIDKDNDLLTNDLVEANNAAIGDVVTYVLQSKVPEMIGYDKYFFIMKDHMSKGLTFNADSIVVTVGDKTLVADTDYTLTVTENEDGTTDLKIVFKNFIQYNDAAYLGKPVVVTYTAELNEDAVLYELANTNDVYLEYSNNPTVDYKGEDEPDYEDEEESKEPLGETPKSEVRTYTTAIELLKVDPMGNRLSGAEFTLSGTALNVVRVATTTFVLDEAGEYWKLTDGTYTTTDPEGEIDGAPVDQTKYDSLTTKYVKETIVEDIVTTEKKEVKGTVSTDGTLRFEGLAAGNFTITEVKAPAGFNPLTEALNVVITWDPETKEFSYEGASDVNGVATVTVLNQAGTELPSTGGTGTTLFYVIGGVLVLAAVVVLVSRKRMSQGA